MTGSVAAWWKTKWECYRNRSTPYFHIIRFKVSDRGHMSFDRPFSVGSYNARHDEIRASRAINFGPRPRREPHSAHTLTAHNLPASSLFLTLYLSLTPSEPSSLASAMDMASALDIVGFLFPVNMCRFTYTWLDRDGEIRPLRSHQSAVIRRAPISVTCGDDWAWIMVRIGRRKRSETSLLLLWNQTNDVADILQLCPNMIIPSEGNSGEVSFLWREAR